MSKLPELVSGQADPAPDGGDCGCCEGIALATPQPLFNRPGLTAVAYRAGRYADMRTSQLARLSAADHPALARLKSRENDDFSIALIDAWSCVCDVLTFYQERHANEAWLGTAVERRSIVELGRLIGYRPRPGVAASTDLVFLMDDPPGVEEPATAATIPAGTRVQSIPGQDETAQTFETAEAVEAGAAWNALEPRQGRIVPPDDGDVGAWLAGTGSGLKAGDALLILSRERVEDSGSGRWDFRKVTKVEDDAAADRTRVEWAPALDSIDPLGTASPTGRRIVALRARASLFGWNAPHPNVLAADTRNKYAAKIETGPVGDWKFTIDSAHGELQLDSIQEGFVQGGWIVVTAPANPPQAYQIRAAIDDGRADYTVSARATRLTVDTSAFLSSFAGDVYRTVSVYGNSEELALAETPIAEPVTGDTIELAGRVEGLEEGRRLVVRGRRAQVVAVTEGLTLVVPGDTPQTLALDSGERLILLAEAEPLANSQVLVWPLRAATGLEGLAIAPPGSFAPVAADATSEWVAEAAMLASVEPVGQSHNRLRLARPLTVIFDRGSTLVHGNVAPATHGETTQEILGDGDAGRAFQSFVLKQAPLTYVSAANESGAQSTLSVRVDDILWHEVPTLYGRGPEERVFETRTGDDGSTVVQFGNGTTGARLPTGRNNVVATYRKGIGVAGGVGKGTLSLALDRPLGLDEVFNPLAAAGGQDAETLASARGNAPMGTLTLGRVVSLANYQQFAAAFAGIARAKADWVWDGEGRRIVVTVAGAGGAAVDSGPGGLIETLTGALRSLGDPLARITVRSFEPAFFRLKARLAVDPDHRPEAVLAAAEAALREAYGFERRGFDPLVASSGVLATLHAVSGIVAVDLDLLHRMSGPASVPGLYGRLLARPVALEPDGSLRAAEILMLDKAPVALEAMA